MKRIFYLQNRIHTLYVLQVLVGFPSNKHVAFCLPKEAEPLNARIRELINQVKLILQLYVINPALGFVTHGNF